MEIFLDSSFAVQENKKRFYSRKLIGSNYKSKSVMNYTTKLISKQQNKTHIFIYMIIYKLKLLLKLILYFTFLISFLFAVLSFTCLSRSIIIVKLCFSNNNLHPFCLYSYPNWFLKFFSSDKHEIVRWATFFWRIKWRFGPFPGLAMPTGEVVAPGAQIQARFLPSLH